MLKIRVVYGLFRCAQEKYAQQGNETKHGAKKKPVKTGLDFHGPVRFKNGLVSQPGTNAPFPVAIR